MDLATWTTQGSDPIRRKRLVFGYTVGSFGAGLVAVAVALTAGKVVMADEDVPVDVTLATAPEEQKAEPEPPPEPEPTPDPAPKAPGPRLPKLAPPKEIPKDKPAESASSAADSSGDGDPYRHGGEGSGGSAKPAVTQTAPPPPPPPPPPKPKPSGPVRLSENDVAPVSISMGAPQYPAAAKSAGVEGTVVVKYVVTETGAVTGVQVVRGPPELHAACIAAVQSWRFKPALRDGTPIAVSRVARFPFRIKT